MFQGSKHVLIEFNYFKFCLNFYNSFQTFWNTFTCCTINCAHTAKEARFKGMQVEHV